MKRFTFQCVLGMDVDTGLFVFPVSFRRNERQDVSVDSMGMNASGRFFP